MAKFVNYKKRGFTLPPGCKDLIDLLHDPKSKPLSLAPAHQLKITRDESGVIQLRELSKYVGDLFDTQAESATLILTLPDERFTISLHWMGAESMLASVTFQEDPVRERLMREFFTSHNLQLPSHNWTPASFDPGVPVDFIFPISPLPTTASATSDLITEIFQHVCSLTDDATLKFHYAEMAYAA